MFSKETAALVSTIIAAASNVVYLRAAMRGAVKPHVFSWIVWALLMFIGAAAQYSDQAGVGAWATGIGGVMCLVVAGLSLFYGEKTITRGDWASFIAALAVIPLWLVTSSPLTATVLVTLIDGLGFYPTCRKSYKNPHQEAALLFFVFALTNLMRLYAVEHYSPTTALYPAALAVLNLSLVFMLVWRRRIVAAAS
ncbi:MAG: hypothetical protein PHY92_11020 [Alphaproteobacteria bacterium]|nr:hypothetical protein [Alphaproteobacteria bacterium]